jgi:hypothetical protein
MLYDGLTQKLEASVTTTLRTSDPACLYILQLVYFLFLCDANNILPKYNTLIFAWPVAMQHMRKMLVRSTLRHALAA